MMAAKMSRGLAETPRRLFEKASVRFPGGGDGRRVYDLASDGRFLMVVQEDDASQPPITEIALVRNWVAELERLVPEGTGER